VPFHLVDIVDPGERYSAFRFIEDANAAIESILGRGRLPLVVGGTGLYLRALTEGVVEIDDGDLDLRTQLERDMEELGPQAMHARLEQIDPLEAARIHPNNKVRVVRALEIFYQTGRSKSDLAATGAYREPKYTFAHFCLLPDRQALYQVINARVDRMMEQGLLDEVRRLLARGWTERLRKARVIGYTELLDHLEGRITLEEALGRIKQNTRRYAKRQYTWFRRQTGGRVFSGVPAMLAALRKETGAK
jgi:tRNA dimethylallyltransferase